MPYLHDTVVPTLATARQLSGARPDSAVTDPARAGGSSIKMPLPPPSEPATPAARSARTEPDSRPPAVESLSRRRASAVPTADARMTTREVAAHARRLVAEEIRRRGGRVVDHRVGQRTELRAQTRTGRVLELRVLSRRAGDWQTSIRTGDLTATTDDRYWLLVDLAQPTRGSTSSPKTGWSTTSAVSTMSTSPATAAAEPEPWTRCTIASRPAGSASGASAGTLMS